jgi:hypothetical protein
MCLWFILGHVYICIVMTSVIQLIQCFCFVTVSISLGCPVNGYIEVNQITITIRIHSTHKNRCRPEVIQTNVTPYPDTISEWHFVCNVCLFATCEEQECVCSGVNGISMSEKSRMQRCNYASCYIICTLYLTVNSIEQSPSWEANTSSTSQEIPQRFITAFTRAHQLSLSWARSVQSLQSY